MKPLAENGEAHANVFAPVITRGQHSLRSNGFMDFQEKKKYYNYDAIFDKDLLRLKQEL